ncbi:hypothetical protein D3C71_1529480 [compost metagenome]
MAAAVAKPIAMPAVCAPSNGANSDSRCAISPIWANKPSAMPPASVRKARSCHRRGTRGREADDAATGRAASSPSGNWPNCCGVTENTLRASSAITTTITAPTHQAAWVKPACAIKNTHSGENTMPPTLAPL